MQRQIGYFDLKSSHLVFQIRPTPRKPASTAVLT